jgi:hypothetical protein
MQPSCSPKQDTISGNWGCIKVAWRCARALVHRGHGLHGLHGLHELHASARVARAVLHWAPGIEYGSDMASMQPLIRQIAVGTPGGLHRGGCTGFGLRISGCIPRAVGCVGCTRRLQIYIHPLRDDFDRCLTGSTKALLWLCVRGCEAVTSRSWCVRLRIGNPMVVS